jgi:outer membrane immunogenic protein
MKYNLLSATAIALALTTGPSLAADLPTLAPPPVPVPPPPVFIWTGFYIGLNAGGTWSASDTVTTATANTSSIAGLNGDVGGAIAALGTGSVPLKFGGFIGGGQVGYNYQFGSSLVAGIEADFQGVAGAHHSTSLAQAGIVPDSIAIGGGPAGITSLISASKRVDWLGTVRGRLGFLITPTLLAYGTGGLAYGQAKSSSGISEQLGFIDTPAPFGTFGSFSQTRVGWTAGGGLEWMFLPNWSAKVEYLYYDLGRVTYPLTPMAQFGFFGTLLETTSVSQSSTRFNGNLVRAGLNYHFNWGAPVPVVAKY